MTTTGGQIYAIWVGGRKFVPEASAQRVQLLIDGQPIEQLVAPAWPINANASADSAPYIDEQYQEPLGEDSALPDWRQLYDGLRWVRAFLEEAGAVCNAHCDDLVLHRPGECHYCDKHGGSAQQKRVSLGIPFSGEVGAPDALFRADSTIRRWSGNVPVKKGELVSHLGSTFRVGDDEDDPDS